MEGDVFNALVVPGGESGAGAYGWVSVESADTILSEYGVRGVLIGEEWSGFIGEALDKDHSKWCLDFLLLGENTNSTSHKIPGTSRDAHRLPNSSDHLPNLD